MTTYSTFPDPDPVPDIATVRERVAGVNLGLEEVVTDAVGGLFDRTEDQEQQLRQVYGRLVDEAKRRTDEQHERIGEVALPLVNTIRTMNANAAAKLADFERQLPPEVRHAAGRLAAGGGDDGGDSVWILAVRHADGSVCPMMVIRDRATAHAMAAGGRLVYGPMAAAAIPHVWAWLMRSCLSGKPPEQPHPTPELVVPGDGGGGGDGGKLPPPDAVPVPPPVFVPDPEPEPIPEPDPEPEPSPGPPPEPVPDPEECPETCPIKVEIVGGLPCPVPPPPPPAPPPDEGEEEEEEEEEDGGGGSIELPGPPEPGTALTKCNPIRYDDPRLCECIEDHIKWFASLGEWFRDGMDWLHERVAEMTDIDVLMLEAALGAKVLKLISRKFTYNDPTIFEAAHAAGELVELKFKIHVDEWLRATLNVINDMVGVYAPDRRDAIRGLYLAKTALLFVKRWGATYLSHLQGGPELEVEFTHFFTLLDYMIDYILPVKAPTIADVENQWITSMVSDQNARCLVQLHGEQWESVRKTWYSRRVQPTADDYLQFYYRNKDREWELNGKLAGLGFKSQAEMDQLKAARVYLPPPSDAIVFAKRDVFNPKKLGVEKMKEEYEENVGLQELFDAQAMHDTTIATRDGRRMDIKTGLLYWLAHYHNISPTQSFEMIHRLRPGRVRLHKLPGQTDAEADAMVTEIDEVRKLLKEDDYNPMWRDRLAAISYHVIGRLDIRRMYGTKVFGPPLGDAGFNLADPTKPVPVGVAERETAERYMDMGFTRPDANLMALFTVRMWQNQQKTKRRVRVQRITCGMLEFGAIDRDAAVRKVAEVTETPQEAEEFIATCEADAKLRTLKFAVAGVKRQYLSFQIDDITAKQRLAGIGIGGAKAAQFVQDWDLVKLRKPKEASAAEMCGWLGVGLIDRAEFKQRLVRIGYEAGHADRIIRKCELGILAKSAKEQERLVKAQIQERRRKEAAEAKFMKEQATAEQRRLTRFLATRPNKDLIAYFKEGVISEVEIRATLALKGFVPEDIDRWVKTYLYPTPKGEQ